jgi:6-phosphogluconolactonase (cycloisomerase 2 family)
VFVFKFHNGKLTPAQVPEVLARETSGPRHLAFHPTQPLVYVINELDSTVTSCHFDAGTGELKPFQIVSSLADTYTGNSRSSEIEVNRAGTAVYASNRGEDTIAVFAIDAITGRLSLIQSQASQGTTPRFFALSPCNRWMYVLNEDSDSIVSMQVNLADGKLNSTSYTTHCGSPVCMVFI